MAKKKTPARRVPRSATPRMFGDGRPSEAMTQTNGNAETLVAPRTNGETARPNYETLRRRAAASIRAGGEARAQVPLSEEYHYVPGDLKRLGLLATGTAAILVVLGLIIH